MSADTGIGAVKLPTDPELRGALEEYIAALALSARRRELIAAAQASIADADAEVQRTHERCVELGLVPSPRRGSAKRASSPRPIGARGTVAQQAIDAVAAGASNPAAVAEVIGGTSTRAAGVLLALANSGAVHREKDENGRWRYSPIGGDQ